jgi:hypothetical protein
MNLIDLSWFLFFVGGGVILSSRYGGLLGACLGGAIGWGLLGKFSITP